MAYNDKARATVAAKKAAREAALAAAKTAAEANLAANPPETGFVATAHPIPAAPAPQAPAAATEPSPVAPPPNLFSGVTKKLDVFGKPGTDPNEPIPGHQLFWFDDVEGGLFIEQAKASGWIMVSKDEIALNDSPVSPGNNDLGGNVRRWVAQGANGLPVFSYLMKKPNWLYELHKTGPDSIEQRVHKQQEEQLRMGTLQVGPNDGRYTATNPYPGTRSNLPPISIGRYYKPS